MRSKIFTRTVGYWPLKEASGKALDYSGNENHASSTNVSSYGVSGPMGGSAYDFNGSGSVSSPGLSVRNTSVEFTVAAWFKTSKSSVNGPLWMWGDSASVGSSNSAEAPVGWDSSSGNLGSGFYNSGHNSVISSKSWNDSKWHFAVQRATKEGKGYFYVDGGLIGTQTHNYTYGGDTHLIFGARTKDSDSTLDDNTYFDGKIAHVRIWDYPLPGASIKALYNASRGGFSQSDSKNL